MDDITVTAKQVYDLTLVDGRPQEPPKADIIALFALVNAQIQQALEASGLGEIPHYATRALLYADLVPDDDEIALVWNDSTDAYNGLYEKDGATGLGSWIFQRAYVLPSEVLDDIAYLMEVASHGQIVHATDVGAGTPDAIIATTDLELTAEWPQLVRLDVFEANTGSPVTVVFNDGDPLPIKTASGGDIAPGGLTPGPVIGSVYSGIFRLLSDQASAAIQAAAEAARDLAETYRDEAEDARDLAQSYASTAAAQSNVPWYGTTSGLSGITVPVGLLSITTSGYAAVGDKGGVRLARVSSQPSHPGKIRSADRFLPNGSTDAGNGGWWVFDELAINPLMLGASTNSATDSAQAVRDALTVHRAIPGSKVLLTHIYGYQSGIVIAANDVIEGIGRDVCGLLAGGSGSFHGIYGTPEAPAHNAQLRRFSVWSKLETSGTGQFDGIRIHNARGLIIEEVGAFDADALCIRLIDCDEPSVPRTHVGSSTEAKYAAQESWGLFLDGCAHSVVSDGYGYRTGQGFSINGDDSYRRTYASVSDVATDKMTCTDPFFFTNLVTGDEVRVFLMDGVGTMPGGLTENTVYYAIKNGTESDRLIKLAATLADSVAGPAIDITSAGSGTTETSFDGLALFQIDKLPITTSAVADAGTDGITVDATFYRSFTTGQYPLYVTTTGTLPGGASASAIYWAAKVGSNVIKLYDTSAHAITAGATGLIDLTDAGTGTLTVRLAKVATPTRSGNTIDVTPALYEILRTGDPIFFRAAGGAPPAPLVENTVYYVIRTSTYRYIQVATSVANARAGTAITLTDAGSGTQQAVFHSSFGANLSDSLSRRPASEVRGNRLIGCRIERHKNHAFNINSGQDNAGIGCVATDLEEMSGSVLVARASFQIKHSSGAGTDRNFYQGCHAINCGIGFQAQETNHALFDVCRVNEAEYDGFIANSADDMVITTPTVVRAKRYVFWGISSARLQVSNFDVEAHPNATSILFNLDATGNAVIGAGRHTGTFAYALDIDTSSGSFDILPGFRTRGQPISIVPTTGRYPVNLLSGEIDLSVAGIRCLAPNVVGLQVARVTRLCTVATGGSPTLAVGRRDSTGVLVAAAAPPATADLTSISMSPAGVTWLLAGGKTPAAEVVAVGTGKVIVELSGMAST